MENKIPSMFFAVIDQAKVKVIKWKLTSVLSAVSSVTSEKGLFLSRLAIVA